jgi:3-oxoacyl-[acyl-carrier protein] reductase
VFYRRQEFEPETFRKVIDVNLTAVLQLSTRLHDRLSAAPGGSIVNVTSLTGFFSSRGNPAYGASKAALVQLTKSLAVAWARDDIRVNAIAPGWVKTKMTEVSWGNQEINHAIVARTPLGRWAAPEEMAGPALFLASPLASYVTGETLLVDGGFSLVI